MKQKLLGGALGLVLLAGAGALGAFLNGGTTVQAQQEDGEENQGPPPARVVVLEARTQQMAPMVQMPATVMSPSDSVIAAAISGSVTWIADVGADVAKGEVIARIDDRDWRLERDDAAADIKRLEGRLDLQTKEVERVRELARTGNSPQSRLEQALADMGGTQQELERAKNALKRAAVRIERASVRAPFPGRVVERRAQVGEFANPGGELLRLVDVSNREIRAQIPVGLASSVKPGLGVFVHDDAGSKPAQVRTIVPVGDEVSRSVELRVRADEGDWLIGTPVRVGLPSAAPRDVVAVHRDALVLRAGSAFVFVIDEDMTARRVAVRTGSADGAFIEVLGDLEPGDAVVIRGGERLRPGQEVELRPLSETTLAEFAAGGE